MRNDLRSVVYVGELEFASIAEMDVPCRCLAERADWLNGRQRRYYSVVRAYEISQLQRRSDVLVSRLLAKGWK